MLMVSGSKAVVGRLLVVLAFCVAHTLTNFVLYRVFSVVELTDTTTETAHQFGDFIAAKQQQYNQKDNDQFAGTQIAEKQKQSIHSISENVV